MIKHVTRQATVDLAVSLRRLAIRHPGRFERGVQ